MARTNWDMMVSGSALSTEKRSRKKVFISQKILSDELPIYVDLGWEKSKEYKSKKYVGISKEKTTQEQFEDRVWTLLSNMGFTELNINDFEMSYDFHNDNLKEKISVMAVDDETIIIVSCHASESLVEHNFYDEITEFNDKIAGLRKEALKHYTGRKVKFIWATHNYISNRKDLALLDKLGIAYFSESTIEYYSELAKHLGSCSRYQLLGSLFANQEIKNMDNRIPAIQGKMGGYTYYSFSIEPEKLLKIRVINDIVNMLVEKGIISPKTQDINDMFSLIEYYLKPLTEYLNALTPEHRKNLRGYFGGGADTRFWRAYQKAIADSRPDFNPEGLNEYWQNESKEYNDDTRTMLKELESRIKMVISSKLEDYYGESWLIKGLPKSIYTKAKNEADEAIYESVANNGDEIDIPIWDYVPLSDCKQIIINGKNWSMLFEDIFVRPEEEKISGGKEAKTEWVIRLNTITNKLQNDKYSVPVDEYSFVKSVYDWFMGILI